jgi:hypothetical protein
VSKDSLEKALLCKFLGDNLMQTILTSQSRYVLIVSAKAGEGKTFFIDLIRDHLEKFYSHVNTLDLSELSEKEPEVFDGRVVVIDGPSLNEGPSSLQLPRKWQIAIDSAVILVMGRQSGSTDLKETELRLEAMGIRSIGVIFNELKIPTFRSLMNSLRFRHAK